MNISIDGQSPVLWIKTMQGDYFTPTYLSAEGT